MSETKMLATPKTLALRFAAPAVAVWLLHLGMWTLLFVVEQPVMGLLTQTQAWIVDHFFADSSLVETTSWQMRGYAPTLTEGAVFILLGLLLGAWVRWRKCECTSATTPPLEK